MTQTGGFAFLIAWGIFLALCGLLAWLVLRRSPRSGWMRRARRRRKR